MNEIKISSNKSFGIVFSIFFALIAAYVFYKFENISILLIFLSILFLVLGLIKSILLTPLNILWFKFGIFLSKLISPIIMALIFFVVVTPLALLAKIVKKDFLELDKKKNKKKLSYWIEKEKYNNSMKDQF
jgi:large-conductance mechanosensitive channel